MGFDKQEITERMGTLEELVRGLRSLGGALDPVRDADADGCPASSAMVAAAEGIATYVGLFTQELGRHRGWLEGVLRAD